MFNSHLLWIQVVMYLELKAASWFSMNKPVSDMGSLSLPAYFPCVTIQKSDLERACASTLKDEVQDACFYYTWQITGKVWSFHLQKEPHHRCRSSTETQSHPCLTLTLFFSRKTTIKLQKNTFVLFKMANGNSSKSHPSNLHSKEYKMHSDSLDRCITLGSQKGKCLL